MPESTGAMPDEGFQPLHLLHSCMFLNSSEDNQASIKHASSPISELFKALHNLGACMATGICLAIRTCSLCPLSTMHGQQKFGTVLHAISARCSSMRTDKLVPSATPKPYSMLSVDACTLVPLRCIELQVSPRPHSGVGMGRDRCCCLHHVGHRHRPLHLAASSALRHFCCSR